jgi:Fe-S cluster biogenesis protein NfuA
MFIQTEATPNPATLKFIPGKPVTGGPPREYRSADEAADSPLAERLFTISGITGVFLGADFVTVSKGEGEASGSSSSRPSSASSWSTICQGRRSSSTRKTEDRDTGEFFSEEDGQIVQTIKELLDTRVRPAVAQDGGDITFHGYRDGVVYLNMRGACSGCPSSTATLKHGIENLLRHFVPRSHRGPPVLTLPGRIRC